MNFYDNVAKAYAEIDRLRAELAERDKTLSVMARRLSIADDRMDAAEAAIARVRELCAKRWPVGLTDWQRLQILRALDGGTE